MWSMMKVEQYVLVGDTVYRLARFQAVQRSLILSPWLIFSLHPKLDQSISHSSDVFLTPINKNHHLPSSSPSFLIVLIKLESKSFSFLLICASFTKIIQMNETKIPLNERENNFAIEFCLYFFIGEVLLLEIYWWIGFELINNSS